MKKFLVSLLLLLLAVGSVGCGRSPQIDDKTTPEPSSSQKQPEEKSLEVKKELFDVKVTLPASMFEEEDLESVKKDALEEGVAHEVIINDDGSVTYIMSKSQHRKILADLRKTIDESVTEFLADEESKTIFKEGSYSKDYTELTVKVDASQYNHFQALMLIGLDFSGLMYQRFNGVEDVSIKNNVLDYFTGDIIESFVYPSEEQEEATGQ